MNLPLHGNALFALAAATIWGGGDFSGGTAVKAANGSARSAFRIILISHTISLVVLLLLSLRWGGPFLPGVWILWALVAGLLATLGLTAFYVSLSGAAMGASAALSGLLAAAIPAAVSFLTEGLPGPLRLAGFLLAGVAIWRIAAGPTPPSVAGQPAPAGAAHASARRTMLLAILGGIGFGFYFVALKIAGHAGLLWPMTIVRLGSAGFSAILVLFTLRPRQPRARVTTFLPRRALHWALGCALLDTGGNLLFLASTRLGRLDVASVLASLYPASTILLAAWLFHERPTRRQGLGMALAAAAVVMIVL